MSNFRIGGDLTGTVTNFRESIVVYKIRSLTRHIDGRELYGFPALQTLTSVTSEQFTDNENFQDVADRTVNSCC
jgi:hypothetical protein